MIRVGGCGSNEYIRTLMTEMCVPATRSQELPCPFHHLKTQLEEGHLRIREWVLITHGISDFQLPEE